MSCEVVAMAAGQAGPLVPPLPLVERKQKAAWLRIVAAATKLLAERGFDGASVSDIADLAEVGRTTFFRHFSDKQRSSSRGNSTCWTPSPTRTSTTSRPVGEP